MFSVFQYCASLVHRYNEGMKKRTRPLGTKRPTYKLEFYPESATPMTPEEAREALAGK